MDTARVLTRGGSFAPGVLRSFFSPATGAFTWICTDQCEQPVLGQFAHIPGEAYARLTLLAPVDALESDITVELLEGLARQAGEQQVDIMLDPSYDAPKSGGPIYYLRAIENGFSMVRPTYNGYSYAIDYNGNLLASMDSDETETGIMYADVPTQGVNTLYSTIGDILGWICLAGFLGFFPLNIILRKRQNKEKG